MPDLDHFMAMSHHVRTHTELRHIPENELGGDVVTYWAALNPLEATGIWFVSFYNGAFPAVVTILPLKTPSS
jgi:hypothetical protein